MGRRTRQRSGGCVGRRAGENPSASGRGRRAQGTNDIMMLHMLVTHLAKLNYLSLVTFPRLRCELLFTHLVVISSSYLLS